MKNTIKETEGLFDISVKDMKKIIIDFHKDMARGLCGKKSSLKMLPAYVDRPKGDERGTFIALDLGGTNFRVLDLELKGRRKSSTPVSDRHRPDGLARRLAPPRQSRSNPGGNGTENRQLNRPRRGRARSIFIAPRQKHDDQPQAQTDENHHAHGHDHARIGHHKRAHARARRHHDHTHNQRRQTQPAQQPLRAPLRIIRVINSCRHVYVVTPAALGTITGPR